MKNWTIKQRILTHSAILCAVIAGIGLAAVGGIESVERIGASLADDSIPGTIGAQAIRLGRTKTQILLLRMALAKTPEELASLQAENKRIGDEVTAAMTAYEATVFDPADRADFEAVKKARADYMVPKRRYMDALATDHAAAMEIFANEVVPASAAYDKVAETLLTFNTTQAGRRGDRLKALVREFVLWISVAGGSAVAAGIAVSLFNIRNINRALTEVSESLQAGASQVAAAANQVSGASQSLAEGASEQAASLEETSASVEEIGGMTRHNSASAQEARDLSTEARAAAEEGASHTSGMTEAMTSIQESTVEMSRTIDGIRASSQEVSKIAKMIDGIAFQTNILSLNAAVEAARAGQAGAGFAVVADEVRSLAQRCAEAAKETSRMIEDSLAQSARGVEVSARVSGQIAAVARTSQSVRESLENIVRKTREADARVAEISNASQEQSSGLSQIGTAMTQIDQVTQSNAATAEEAASAAEELNAQSAELQTVVGALVRLVGGGKRGGSEERAIPLPVAETVSRRPLFPAPVPVPLVVTPRRPLPASIRREAPVLAGGFADF